MTTHVINFTDGNGKKVRKAFFGTLALVKGLKTELRKNAIRRNVTSDAAELRRLNDSDRSLKNLLAMYDGKSELSRAVEALYESR